MERCSVKLDEYQKAKYTKSLPELTKLDAIKILMIAQYYDTLKTKKTGKRSYSIPTEELFKARKSKNFVHFAYLYLLLKTYRIEYKLYIEASMDLWSRQTPYPSQLTSMIVIKHYIKYKIRKAKMLGVTKVTADVKALANEEIKKEIINSTTKVSLFIQRRLKKGQDKLTSKTEFLLGNFLELSPYYVAGFPEIVENLDRKRLEVYHSEWLKELGLILNNQYTLNLCKTSIKSEERFRKIPQGILNLEILEETVV